MFEGSRGQIAVQIKDWLQSRIVPGENKELGRVKKLILRHLDANKRIQGDLESIPISEDAGMIDELDPIVIQIADKAQKEANSLASGVQLFAVYAYYTKDASFCPRKIFRVAADNQGEEGAESSEPPTEKGLVTQLMRHNEITSKNSMVSMGYMFGTFQKEMSRLREQNETFSQRHIETMALMQDMLDSSYKRQIEAKQAEVYMSMLEGTFDHLKIALPVLVNRLAGKEIIGSKMDQSFYMLATLLETLTPEQQMFLRDKLDPKQLAVLGEILRVYEEHKHKLDKKSGDGTSTKVLGSLFEQRRQLVEKKTAVVIEHERLQDIEKRAKSLLGTVRENLAKKDAEDKKKSEAESNQPGK